MPETAVATTRKDVERIDKQMRMHLHTRIMYKMRSAGWQVSWTQLVDRMKREYLKRHCDVDSSRDLSGPDLERACLVIEGITIARPADALYAVLSLAQRRTIVRIGKYVLAPVYGESWYWAQQQVWVNEFLAGTVVDTQTQEPAVHRVKRIDDLTLAEARYVIQRLEKIEAKLHMEGKL